MSTFWYVYCFFFFFNEIVYWMSFTYLKFLSFFLIVVGFRKYCGIIHYHIFAHRHILPSLLFLFLVFYFLLKTWHFISSICTLMPISKNVLRSLHISSADSVLITLGFCCSYGIWFFPLNFLQSNWSNKNGIDFSIFLEDLATYSLVVLIFNLFPLGYF